MNTMIKYLLGFLLFTSALAGADIYPLQPKLRAAHDSLMSARNHLQRSLQGQAQKHINEASIALSSAQNNLENAMKNKGSSRLAAIREIKAALAEIASDKSGSPSAEAAIQYVDRAIKEVAESARAGRR